MWVDVVLYSSRNISKYRIKIIKKTGVAAKEKKLAATFVFIQEQFYGHVKKIS